jgi:hypothetical protein
LLLWLQASLRRLRRVLAARVGLLLRSVTVSVVLAGGSTGNTSALLTTPIGNPGTSVATANQFTIQDASDHVQRALGWPTNRHADQRIGVFERRCCHRVGISLDAGRR